MRAQSTEWGDIVERTGEELGAEEVRRCHVSGAADVNEREEPVVVGGKHVSKSIDRALIERTAKPHQIVKQHISAGIGIDLADMTVAHQDDSRWIQ